MGGACNDDETSRVRAVRGGMPRIHGARPSGVITARVVRSIPAVARSQSSTNFTKSLLARCGVLITAAATFVMTVVLCAGKITPVVSISKPSPVEYQSLYASRGRRGGLSIVANGRTLQEEEDTAVTYETDLHLFMCNPSLVEEGNDAYLVDTESLAVALSRILVLGQSDPDDIEVTIKTGPLDGEDDTYMCDTHGMLQWHAKIHYGADDAAALKTTPAVMAAKANDFVAYSSNDFKILLSAFINDEYSTSAQAVDVSADDIMVSNVGWTVTFASQAPTLREAETTGSSYGLDISVVGDGGLWTWWVWLVFAILLACCMGPVCCCLCRRRGEKGVTEVLDTTRDGRSSGDSPDDIRDPEWGSSEPDLEEDYYYNEEEDKRDHHDVRGVPSHSASNQLGHRSGQALIKETGKRSTWAQPAQPSSRTPPRSDRCPVVRHLDIEGGDNGEGAATSRSKSRQYSSDTRVRSGRVEA